MESARRASEIHKRRTGRALRVTEQDVINEEMYEEEDDGLPLQYRRLTAHLQTGSSDFNRRLAAYLTSNVAMRSALDQAITTSYAQQYPNARQFTHNQPGMFPSPLLTQGLHYPSQQQQPVISGPPMSPHPYRQAPYPTPGAPGFRPSSHRSESTGSPRAESEGNKSHSESPVIGAEQAQNRRSSMQVPSFSSSGPVSPMSSYMTNPSPLGASQDNLPTQAMGRPAQPQQYGISPFSTTLPMESQMLVGHALDPNDPLTAMLLGRSANAAAHSFNDPTFFDFLSKDGGSHQQFDGMNATLAPNAMNPMLSPNSDSKSSFPTLAMPTPTPNYAFDSTAAEFKGLDFASPNSDHNNNATTPLDDGTWDAYISDNSWTGKAA